MNKNAEETEVALRCFDWRVKCMIVCSMLTLLNLVFRPQRKMKKKKKMRVQTYDRVTLKINILKFICISPQGGSAMTMTMTMMI